MSGFEENYFSGENNYFEFFVQAFAFQIVPPKLIFFSRSHGENGVM